MPLVCNICGASKFRGSRFREQDIPRLFTLQLPVRCRKCHERTYASFLRMIAPKRQVDTREP